MFKLLILLSTIALLLSCQQQQKRELPDHQDSTGIRPAPDSIAKQQLKADTGHFTKKENAFEEAADTAFIEVDMTDIFAFDMKYATADNFLDERVYDCPKCLLRKEVVKALIVTADQLKDKGYRIKFYDCYRPLYIQKKMWEIMPDSRYVANPSKSGSIHNRGAAVDITLVDASGEELDMGTAFDHFGEEAHHAYTNLPEEVLKNRKLLKRIMEGAGFKAQISEWWHYSFIGSSRQYPLSNTPIICD